MKTLIFSVAVSLLTFLSNGASAQQFLSVSQFRHLPGVEVIIEKANDMGLTTAIIEWYDNPNFLALYNKKARWVGPSQLSVRLSTDDAEKHPIMNVSLDVERISSGLRFTCSL